MKTEAPTTPTKTAPIRYDLKAGDRLFFPEDGTTFEVIDSFPNGVNLRGIHADENDEKTYWSYVSLSAWQAVRVCEEEE